MASYSLPIHMLAWSEILLAKDFTKQVQAMCPSLQKYFTFKLSVGTVKVIQTLIIRENHTPHSITNTTVVVHLTGTLSR